MTTRWYAAAYEADNGNIIPIAPPNVVAEYAEQDADRMRSPEDTTEIFVAYRDMPGWKRLET